MTSLTVLQHPRSQDTADMLAVVDTLRSKIEAGEFTAFAAVSINEGDECFAFTANRGHVTRLRVCGAVSHLLACLHNGEV